MATPDKKEARLFDLINHASKPFNVHIGKQTITGCADAFLGTNDDMTAVTGGPFEVDFGPVQIRTLEEATDVKSLLNNKHIVSVRFKTASRQCKLRAYNIERVPPETLIDSYGGMTITCTPDAWNLATLNPRRARGWADSSPTAAVPTSVLAPYVRGQMVFALVIFMGLMATMSISVSKEHNALGLAGWLLIITLGWCMGSAVHMMHNMHTAHMKTATPDTFVPS